MCKRRLFGVLKSLIQSTNSIFRGYRTLGWQIRVGKDLGSQMQYLYVTDICEFLLGVKYVGVHNNSLYVKLINTDNTQITTQVGLTYFNIKFISAT